MAVQPSPPISTQATSSVSFLQDASMIHHCLLLCTFLDHHRIIPSRIHSHGGSPSYVIIHVRLGFSRSRKPSIIGIPHDELETTRNIIIFWTKIPDIWDLRARLQSEVFLIHPATCLVGLEIAGIMTITHTVQPKES